MKFMPKTCFSSVGIGEKIMDTFSDDVRFYLKTLI